MNELVQHQLCLAAQCSSEAIEEGYCQAHRYMLPQHKRMHADKDTPHSVYDVAMEVLTSERSYMEGLLKGSALLSEAKVASSLSILQHI